MQTVNKSLRLINITVLAISLVLCNRISRYWDDTARRQCFTRMRCVISASFEEGTLVLH